jgi:PAS domain S-box-containing protein
MAEHGPDAWRDLASLAATSDDAEQLVHAAWQPLRLLTGAAGLVMLRRTGETWSVTHAVGAPLDVGSLGEALDAAAPEQLCESLTSAPGVGELACRPLPGHLGVLVLTWHDRPEPGRTAALELLTTALALLEAEHRYDDLVRRVDNAQMLADMGDYDWHIESDTNQWSDQLYRIYGHEPQSFNASYERFLSFIHPDDRERIAAVHQRAYATGEPYAMIERIVRADGELRYLSSNGQVIMDDDGRPVRMRGTCIDITERVRAEQEREEHAAALREGQVRRRQALEINDNVVQGLATALYALRDDDSALASSLLERTLKAARRMMSDLLQPVEGAEVGPGDLVRSAPSRLDEDHA